MVKQRIYMIDIGKSELSDVSTISGYTLVNSGSEMTIDADNVSMQIGKSVTADIDIGRFDSTGYYKEGSVQHNSAANRSIVISGVLDISKSANQTIYQQLCLVARSPSIFAVRCELTNYADDPNSTYNDANLSTNIVAGKYMFFTFGNFAPTTSASDQNLILYQIDGVLVND